VFERFTDRARRVVVLAQEEARLLNHNYIGTEHILLGLIHEEEGVAARVLESVDVSLLDVRAQVEEIVGHGGQSPSGHIPFTPRAKTVLEMSLREAMQLGHNYIGTEHILLGLVREGEGVAAQVLAKFGIDLSRLRQAVIQQLSGGASSGEHIPAPGEVGLEPTITFTGTFTGDEIRPATCAFCGVPSPRCGTLLTGQTGALICERCIRVASRSLRQSMVVRQPLRVEVPVPVLAERITPTGPPPDDEELARQQIEYAFWNVTERTKDGTGLVNVERGENLGAAADQVAQRALAFGPTERTLELIKFVSPTEAVFWSTVTRNGHPIMPTFVHREGRAVLIDGTWKMSRAGMCEIFAMAGVQCPPPPEPPSTPPPAA
jgi:hypothetical protein